MLADAEVVEIDLSAMPRVSRDPNDDPFLATAKAGGAECIVSEDNDLLVMEEYEGIRIVDAAAFLRILDGTDEATANGADGRTGNGGTCGRR